ncbi:MAG: FumA C-terminus/TtdB family hydratase beta subunit [Coriobacteriales bacterium]|jgi:tartrate/fumarate subfamily iron-sulfur-dependent hydro-lyase beta chain|nr:FumA C-terminus/TtdB family hydratase beta subunit [Coriobacteriales bacterium]
MSEHWINANPSPLAEKQQPIFSDPQVKQPLHLNLPQLPVDQIDRKKLSDLRVGDAVLLSGYLYTMRDAGHQRCLQELRKSGELPFGLTGQAVFYAGPTAASAGRPFASIGPTTASRMDFAAPELYQAGICLTLGKGMRSAAVADSCAQTGSVHLSAVGGAAALLARSVLEAELLAWEDLGPEALYRLRVKDLPAFVTIDARGVQFDVMQRPEISSLAPTILPSTCPSLSSMLPSSASPTLLTPPKGDCQHE